MSTAWNADEHEIMEATTEFKPFEGEYKVVVEDAEDINDEKGQRFKLTLQVIEGEHKGRKVWPFFNIGNKNPVAAQIGRSEFKQLTEAIGHPRFHDVSEIKDKKCIATFSIDAKNADYPQKVGGYKSCGASPSQTEATAAPTPAPVQAVAAFEQ